MLAKRVIPCLDVHNGLVTRGQKFGRAEENGLRNVGDPVELAIRYNDQGADELVFFDITASSEGRKSIIDVIERTADRCFMPLTVGGGVRSTDDMRALLRAGADKISLNSAALARPEIISEGAAAFGSVEPDFMDNHATSLHSWNFGVDLGMVLEISSGVRLGLTADQLNPKRLWDVTLRPQYRAGLQLDLGPQTKLSLEGDLNAETTAS